MNTIELNDEEARKLGFENLAELLQLVAEVNLSSAVRFMQNAKDRIDVDSIWMQRFIELK